VRSGALVAQQYDDAEQLWLDLDSGGENAVTARSADLWRITPNHFSCSSMFARVREVTVSRGKSLFAHVRG